MLLNRAIPIFGIAAGTPPDEAMQRRRWIAGFSVFQLGDLDNRFPYIDIEASAAVDRAPGSVWKEVEEKVREKARETARRDIARIREKYDIEKTGEFKRIGGIFSPYNAETTERVRLLFPIGTDIGAVEVCLMESKLFEKKCPRSIISKWSERNVSVSSKAISAGTDNFFKTISAYAF